MKNNKKYEVSLEVAGSYAMFSRPDTGAAPVSFPCPTWSSSKALFESVARGFFSKGKTPPAFFCPTRIEILNPIRYERYVTNYRGPLREKKNITKGASYQLQATVLTDVHFRIFAECQRIPNIEDSSGNAPHALAEIFERRLGVGHSKYAPSLGWKEFIPSYFGPVKSSKEPLETINEQIPAFLLSVWDAPCNGEYHPSFYTAEINSGILMFPEARVLNGKLKFSTNERN